MTELTMVGYSFFSLSKCSNESSTFFSEQRLNFIKYSTFSLLSLVMMSQVDCGWLWDSEMNVENSSVQFLKWNRITDNWLWFTFLFSHLLFCNLSCMHEYMDKRWVHYCIGYSTRQQRNGNDMTWNFFLSPFHL